MAKSFREAVSASIVRRDPREIFAIKKDPDYSLSSTPFGSPPGAMIVKNAAEMPAKLYLKKAVVWKGKPEAMYPGVKLGVGKIIALSRAAIGTLGTTVGPKGTLIPAKGVKQMELSPRVKPLTPEERRERQRVGVARAERLGITIPAI